MPDTQMNSKIIAEGAYLPSKIVSNSDLAQTLDTSDEWIIERTGIKSRHIAAYDEMTSDLAVAALLDALNRYQIDKESIDALIVATTTPDQIFPSTAAIVHGKMGLKQGCFSFDLAAVCSGFIYAMSIADSLIKSGSAKRVAVIGAEVMSRILDWNDRSTCILFGDGAGTIILEATQEKDVGILGYNLFSDGACKDILKVQGGVSAGQMDAKVFMNGREVFKNAVDKMAKASAKLLSSLDISIDDVNWAIPHQANQRILDAVAQKLKLPKEKMISTVATHANTSAASIALAYSHAVRSRLVKDGDIIIMAALGSGLTWGSLVYKA
jgi:3-oxoacyl-[acyl-carrier-protein] synthase-3